LFSLIVILFRGFSSSSFFRDASSFYKYALVGMTLEWIRRDMKNDPKQMVERVSTMIHGDFRRALCRLSTGSLKIEE